MKRKLLLIARFIKQMTLTNFRFIVRDKTYTFLIQLIT